MLDSAKVRDSEVIEGPIGGSDSSATVLGEIYFIGEPGFDSVLTVVSRIKLEPE